MAHEILQTWLKKTALSNPARFGSFAEFVFEALAKKRHTTVERVHRNECDFSVDGLRIDVKATQANISKGLGTKQCKAWKGRRVEGVSYGRVEFCLEGARVSLEGRSWGIVNWFMLERKYEAWKADRASKRPQKNTKPKLPRESFHPIKRLVVAIAQQYGRKARVIHRTCQTRFGYANPPHNLVSDREKYDLHIFVSFHDSKLDLDNIERIFAIPDEAVDALPQRQLDGLSQGVPKIDLLQAPPRFVFDSFETYEHEFQHRKGLPR